MAVACTFTVHQPKRAFPLDLNMAASVASGQALPADSKEYAINLDGICAAHTRVKFAVHRTPVITCDSICQKTGLHELFFKVEALQKSGSFKVRAVTHTLMRSAC